VIENNIVLGAAGITTNTDTPLIQLLCDSLNPPLNIYTVTHQLFSFQETHQSNSVLDADYIVAGYKDEKLLFGYGRLAEENPIVFDGTGPIWCGDGALASLHFKHIAPQLFLETKSRQAELLEDVSLPSDLTPAPQQCTILQATRLAALTIMFTSNALSDILGTSSVSEEFDVYILQPGSEVKEPYKGIKAEDLFA
jgi:hypothetical protein